MDIYSLKRLNCLNNHKILTLKRKGLEMKEQIRRLKRINISLTKKAKDLGFARSTLQRWFNKGVEPSEKSLEKVERYLMQRIKKATVNLGEQYRKSPNYKYSENLVKETIKQSAPNVKIKKCWLIRFLDWILGGKV